MTYPAYTRWLTDEQKEQLREDGNFVGGVVLLTTVALTFAFSLLVTALLGAGVFTPEQVQDAELGLTHTQFMLLYAAVYSFCMGGTALLVCALFRKRCRHRSGVRTSFGTHMAAFFIALGGCVVATYVANMADMIFRYIGYTPTPPESHLQNTPVSLLLNLFVVGLLPALLEEFVFRNCVMGTLRKYGTGVAVVLTSVLFAVVHSSPTQVIYVFTLSLFLCYVTVKTGDVWTAVAVHFCNNAMSVLIEYLGFYMSEEAAGLIYFVYMVLVALAAIIALVVAILTDSPLFKRQQPLSISAGTATKRLCATPLMIISFILVVLHFIYVNCAV